jgi:hypothetical protein
MMTKYAMPLFFGALALAVPGAVYAQAALYLEPATGVYPIGEPFTIDVRIDTAGASIGTIDAAIVFDPEDVQFVSVSDDGSVMSRIIVDSGSLSGRVDLSGFIEREVPAYNGTNGLLARMTFTPLRNVATEFRFAQGAATPPLQLNASVGSLANILGSLRSASYTFVPKEIFPQARVAGVSTDATGSFPITPLPVPDNEWFGTTSIKLSWTLPENIDEMRTFVGTEDEEKETVYQVPLSSVQLSDVPEGKQFFIIQFKTGDAWGEATRFPLNVDLSPPETIVIREADRDTPTDKNAFVVEATDELSGIARYEMSVDGGETVPWDGQGTFTPEVPGPGEHVLTVTAYDKVGNHASKDQLFLVRSLDAPALTSIEPERILTGDQVIVRGTSYPNATVKAFISFNEGEAEEKSVQSDTSGAFEAKVTDGARAGTYTMWFQASNAEGAMSPLSIKRSFTVSQPYIMLWGGVAVTYLSVIVPLLALIILLGLVLWLGYTFLRGYKKRIRRETTEVYEVVNEEFTLLRDELRKQIGMLEKANQSRELTREEMKIFNDLSRKLDYIERHIEQEIEDISAHDAKTDVVTLQSRDTASAQHNNGTPTVPPVHTIRVERR